MMLTEDKISEMLSKSENTVYEYIKRTAQSQGGSMKESMKEIGNHLGLSEATVHRAVRKLRKQGVIGIVPSMEKAESNEIIYYGVPDPDKQVGEIFQMIGELSSSAKRFQAVIDAEKRENEKLKHDKLLLYKQIDQLKLELEKLRAEKTGFDPSKIISSQPLGDGTTAYIIKD